MWYKIFLVDPPWEYTDKAKAGNRGAECKYECMGLQEIKALNVKSIADPDSALFLWTTMPMLPAALEVMAEWGYEYKTVAFVWVKANKRAFLNPAEIMSNTIDDFFGMGNWTRSNAELCLLGIRGKIKRQSAAVRQIIFAPIEEHSKKPDETRDRIVQLLGDLPRMELFARQAAPGWDAIGYGIDGRDIREVLRG